MGALPRSHDRRRASARILLWCLAVFVTYSSRAHAQSTGDSPESCCATCLAQPRVGSADALDFQACAAAQTTCCFDKTCQPATFGPPTYDLTLMTFADTDMLFPAGNWLRLQWPTAAEVKFLALKTGQPKTTQVTNASVAATPKAGGFFFVCPVVEGKLFFRAFAQNGCTASKELSITITRGNGSTCSDAVPSAPISNGDCDPVRGAMLNGVCTCLEDFAGPPQCLSNSFWKRWGQIITYTAGGLSTITAMFGFYRFYKMRQSTKDVTQRHSVMVPHPTDHEGGRVMSPQHTNTVAFTTPAPSLGKKATPSSKDVTQHAPSQVRLTKLSALDDRRPRRDFDEESSNRSSVSDVVLLDGSVASGYHHDCVTATDRTSHEFTL